MAGVAMRRCNACAPSYRAHARATSTVAGGGSGAAFALALPTQMSLFAGSLSLRIPERKPCRMICGARLFSSFSCFVLSPV